MLCVLLPCSWPLSIGREDLKTQLTPPITHLHFTPKETEAQRGKACVQGHPSSRWQSWDLGAVWLQGCVKQLHDTASPTTEREQAGGVARYWDGSGGEKDGVVGSQHPKQLLDQIQMAVCVWVGLCVNACPLTHQHAHGNVCCGRAKGRCLARLGGLDSLAIQSPRTSSMGLACKLVRNAESQPLS